MMKQFENVLCVACVNGNAGCPTCPMRDKVNQEPETAETTEIDAALEDDVYAMNRKNHGYQRRKNNIKERVHQDTVIEISFPEEFWSKIKGCNVRDLIKQAESWKKNNADDGVVSSCDTMISELKKARACGGISKGAWWGTSAVMKIRLDFPNKKSLNAFKITAA